MKNKNKQFLDFSVKIMIAHIITYFIAGLIFSNLFQYQRLFESDIINHYMKPYSAFVLTGPFLQPIRGFLFAIAIWPFRDFLLKKTELAATLLLWEIMLIFGILNTPAAAPCSIEGMIYSRLPLWYHLLGLPEICLQTLAFSYLTYEWTLKKPNERQQNPDTKILSQCKNWFDSIVIGCFAYMGYAAGALFLAWQAGYTFVAGSMGGESILQETKTINLNQAAQDWKMQLMFVVALIFNITFIHLMKLLLKNKQVSGWYLFGFFLLLDASIPFVYQSLVFSRPSVGVVIILGLLPALIITIYLKQMQNNSK